MPQGTGAIVFFILFLLFQELAMLLVVETLQHFVTFGVVAYIVVSTHE